MYGSSDLNIGNQVIWIKYSLEFKMIIYQI
jgi:hypothetical protein